MRRSNAKGIRFAAVYSAMHSPETFLRADYEGDGVLPPPAFEKYVPLTVSGYAGASTLTNFPVLVRVSESAMPGFSYAKAGGREGVRFTDDEGRYLVFECDTWDPLGESLFWVSVPELSGTVSRDENENLIHYLHVRHLTDGYWQEPASSGKESIPLFDGTGLDN